MITIAEKNNYSLSSFLELMMAKEIIKEFEGSEDAVSMMYPDHKDGELVEEAKGMAL